MFQTQHCSSSGEEETFVDEESQEKGVSKRDRDLLSRSRLEKLERCSYGNCLEKPAENKIVCCQELSVLGHRLNLKGKGFFFLKSACSAVIVILLKKTVLPSKDPFHIAD